MTFYGLRCYWAADEKTILRYRNTGVHELKSTQREAIKGFCIEPHHGSESEAKLILVN